MAAVHPPMKFRSLNNDEYQDDDVTYELYYGHKKPTNFFARIGYFIQKTLSCCCFDVFPPCPCIVIDNFTFQNRKPTYSLELKPGSEDVYTIKFKPNCDVMVLHNGEIQSWVHDIDWYFIKPGHTKRLACFHIKSPSCQPPKFVIMNFHATAVDLNHQLSELYYLSWRLASDVFAVDYTGYGASSGRPSETSIYKDAVAAYDFLLKKLKVPSENIVVFGQSLGTVAAIHLASRSSVRLAGLVLEGVLMSALRVVCPLRKDKILCDRFDSVDKISQISCPTLVFQGGSDQVTTMDGFDHFLELCNSLVPPLVVPAGGHCNLNNYRAYWNRLEIFFGVELGGGKMPFQNNCRMGCTVSHKKRNKYSARHQSLQYPWKDKEQNRFIVDPAKIRLNPNMKSKNAATPAREKVSTKNAELPSKN